MTITHDRYLNDKRDAITYISLKRPPARILRPHPSPLPKEREQEVLAPFSLGRRVGEGFAPLREEGCPDS
ncbi:MAG: hypothetical protein LH660_09895, partial [Phormidesmis sp. CAN_BIN36]|nr:hypothetical protein [Phormidesmis sp. CAN_BIN36]